MNRSKDITVSLTPVEIDHIMHLVLEEERIGSYSGNREQFLKMIERIKNKLDYRQEDK